MELFEHYLITNREHNNRNQNEWPLTMLSVLNDAKK